MKALSNLLERQWSPTYANADVDNIGRIYHRVGHSFDRDDEEILLASSEEEREVFKRLHRKMVSGIEGIPTRALKNLRTNLRTKTTAATINVFNDMLHLRQFQSPW